MPERRWTTALVMLGLTALVVRLAAMLELRSSLFLTTLIGDSLQFDVLARRILSGEWADSGRYYQGQLYPYLLALVYRTLGEAPVAIRTVQACLGAAACVLLAVAGARFFDRRAGLAAGFAMALYPPAIFFDLLVQKSSPDLFFMALLLAGLGVSLQRPRAASLLLVGLAIGALSWNRENARVLYPIVLAWVLLYFRASPVAARMRWALLVTAGVAAVLGPVALRNLSVTGEFFLTTSQSGPNFYIGNHAGASGGYQALVPGRGDAEFERQDAIRLAEADTRRSLSPSEVSDYWWGRALSDIRADPGRWLRLLVKKTWLTFSATEPVDTESLEAYADYSRVLRSLSVFTFGVLLSIGALGAWVYRGRTRELLVLYAMFAALAASVIAFFVFARYRFPLAPIAALFAGAGMSALTSRERWRGRDWLVPVAACAVIGLVLHIPIRTSSDETYANYGVHFLRIGRPADAATMLREAVRRDPGHLETRLSLAIALQRISQPLAAIDELTAATVAAPGSAEAHAGLAAALHQQGRVDAALRSYEQALALKPDSVEMLSNLAMLLQQQGRTEDALKRLGEAVALRPDNLPLHINLGSMLLEAGHPRDAAVIFDRAAAVAKTPGERLQAEYAAGQAYAQAGDAAAAITRLERALPAARAAGEDAAAATIESGLALLRSRR
jgi:tetratricopeptide (TPR) repeat protein